MIPLQIAYLNDRFSDQLALLPNREEYINRDPSISSRTILRGRHLSPFPRFG